MKNRHITAVFVSVMIIIISISSFSTAEDGYSWGMNTDEVVEIMGKSGEIDSANSSGDIVLRYYGEHIKDFEVTLVFVFRNESLYAKMYGVDDDSSKKLYSYLEGELEKKYGNSKDIPSIVIDAIRVMGLELDEQTLSIVKDYGMLAYKTWTPTGDTNIVLFTLSAEETELTMLGYIQSK